MTVRLGVDIGGTFTDLVWVDAARGETRQGKVPTTPAAPEEGVIAAVEQHIDATALGRADYFLHGTTVGLNALLERRGARVGLLCTEGLRDLLEIRRGDRAEMYNPFWQAPEPLVPRYLRRGIAERVRADGSIDRPLDAASVSEAVALLVAEGVDSIAICLINAYANPAHELAALEVVRAAGFSGTVSLSHRVSGEYREYERTSTTVIDAFVRRRMASYLERLEAALQSRGFAGKCLITRSGGGSMTFAEAAERPFETIMSGPVAGAQGAGELARRLGIDALLTADVGGTSFDTTLILDGQPSVLYEGTVDGMPVQTPWIDVRSIGSGGGSIAGLDAGGLMHVGPESAGAVPGPAAYGRGGTLPTTTDAAALLGMLGPGRLAAGIRLDFDRARAALDPLADRLGLDVQQTAVGILRIAAASMANAMREITVEKGLDPRQMTLLPFGGAGPLMGVLLADELHMDRMVLPQMAGNFSAWGLLGADMVQSAARTAIMELDDTGMQAAERILAELIASVDARGAGDEPVHAAALDLRFRGQEHYLTIPVALSDGRFTDPVAAVAQAFRDDYLRTFGALLAQPIEIVSVRTSRSVALGRVPAAAASMAGDGDEPGEGVWQAWSFAKGRSMDFRLLARTAITAAVPGPAIVTEDTTTLYVDAGWQIAPGREGVLEITRQGKDTTP